MARELAEPRSLAERVTPESEHVLDWFHITMRLTVLCQYARGVAHHDAAAGQSLLAELERIKWLLWHGNQYRAGETISFFLDDVDSLEVDYPNLSKFARAAQEFSVYIASNTGSLINYGERFRAGERISSCLAESTVNAVISKRFAKRQQMQWTKRGAHLLLQTRTRALDGTLRPLFEKWYPASPTTTQPGPLRTRPHETPDILMLSYLNNRIEQDHRGIKGRYQPMRGFKSSPSRATAKSAVALRGPLGPFRNGCRAAPMLRIHPAPGRGAYTPATAI